MADGMDVRAMEAGEEELGFLPPPKVLDRLKMGTTAPPQTAPTHAARPAPPLFLVTPVAAVVTACAVMRAIFWWWW
jgi:hypothetical protein